MHSAPVNDVTTWSERFRAVRAQAGSMPFDLLQKAGATMYDAALQAGQPADAGQLALEVALTAFQDSDGTAHVEGWLQRALTHFQDVGDLAGDLVANAVLAMHLGTSPRGAEAAARHLARCLEIGQAAAPSAKQRYLVNLSLAGAYWALGFHEAALRIARPQCELARQVFGPASLEARLAELNMLNCLRYRLEDSGPLQGSAMQTLLQEALGCLPALMPQVDALPEKHRIYAKAVCGLLLARGGQQGEAEAQLREAIALAGVVRSDYATTARAELALLLHRQGRLDEAQALAAQARAGLWRDRHDLRELEAWEWRALASLAEVLGDWREAHDCQQLLAATISHNAMRLLDAKVSSLVRHVDEASLRLHYEELRELNRDLSVQATTDGLTGVLNRKALLAAHAQLALAGRPLAVLMVDADHFKSVNDRFGHPVGDAVLCTLAQLLQRALRGQDCVGRMGGEEFAVLLADSNHAAAGAVAERLRGDVAAFDWPALARGAPEPLALTISIGVAAGAAGESFDAMVARADEALYRAKRSGRNRVEQAG